MKVIKSYILSLFGTIIIAFAVAVFISPNKIVGGGVSGVCTILYHTLNIPLGLSTIIINVALLIIGLKILGMEFTLKTLLNVGVLSVAIEIFSYMPFHTDNTMLATLYGGVLYGIGIGICFASGASSGGTDILGRLCQTRFPAVPIGKILLVIDGLIIAFSLIVFKNLELTLFGVISLIISTWAVDFVIAQLNISRLAFVVTDKGQEISQTLVSTSPRGVTLIDVVGAYTDEKKKMLFCALKESESVEFQRKILEIDNEAFIVFAESQRIKGNGFRLYK